jgi:hypothetical protein
LRVKTALTIFMAWALARGVIRSLMLKWKLKAMRLR